jgi:uncharacterized alpha-E superfamily protein
MLSRVASHIYWFGRHTERAESTARLVGVNANLLLDLPRKMTFGWAPLVAITGGEEIFRNLYPETDEVSVVRFLLADARNPGSILSSLSLARENLRTTRDTLTRETWEVVNELYLYVREQGERSVQRRLRPAFLDRVIRTCQQLVGLLGSATSRDDAFNFMRLGYNVERADMTSRILDIRSESTLPVQDDELGPFQNIQWMSLLKSLSAYQMYRRHVRARVSGPLVLKFLLQNDAFPRAVMFSLNRIEAGLKRLPHNRECLAANQRLKQAIANADVQALVVSGLSEFLDRVQQDLSRLHELVSETYFRIEAAAPATGSDA